MDLLDFEEQALYFEESLSSESQLCIDQAARNYSSEKESSQSEAALLRAYFLAPQHPMVLVALYRFYYYQHRLEDALLVADRVLTTYAKRLQLPDDWRQLQTEQTLSIEQQNLTQLRFYLLALKGAGYLEMRLELFQSASERLNKVVALDDKDRLGAQALIDVLNEKMSLTSQSDE